MGRSRTSWAPSQSGNPSGKADPSTAECRRYIRGRLQAEGPDDYVDAVLELMRQQGDPKMRLAAAKEFADRVMGRPRPEPEEKQERGGDPARERIVQAIEKMAETRPH